MKSFKTVVFNTVGLTIVLFAVWQAQAETPKTLYPSMAPLDQYLMDRNSEIALARSAAPQSIAKDAEVLVMGSKGYETAVKGSNGFVCVVQRSWTAGPDDPEFWNPKVRAPLCYNAPAARSYLPFALKETELILAGSSKTQMVEGIKEALAKKEIPPVEANSMVFMLSKTGYLNDGAGAWRPHVMVISQATDASVWGANSDASPRDDSPVIALPDDLGHATVFLIPVAKWSDGTAAPPTK
jgi:hypothetical protein